MHESDLYEVLKLLLAQLQNVILPTGLFVYLWFTLTSYTTRNGPLVYAPTVTRLNSQIYSVASLVMAYLILNDVFHFQTYTQ